MGYITVQTEVDIDYDDLDEDELIEALSDKLDKYARKTDPKNLERFKELKKAITDLGNEASEPESLAFTDLPGTILEETTIQVLRDLAKKYTLEELEKFLKE